MHPRESIGKVFKFMCFLSDLCVVNIGKGLSFVMLEYSCSEYLTFKHNKMFVLESRK